MEVLQSRRSHAATLPRGAGDASGEHSATGNSYWWGIICVSSGKGDVREQATALILWGTPAGHFAWVTRGRTRTPAYDAGFGSKVHWPEATLSVSLPYEKETQVVRAWLMDSYEGVEKLRLGEVADPRPGPGQVLLRVRFAAINPADAFLAQAMYPARPPLPHVLGRDGVGDILAVGPDVDTARVGETVGILRGSTGVEAWGTFAEKVVVPAANIVPVPRGWSLEETAGAPLVFLTAWQALTQWSDPPAPPRAGSVLLVTGASGGVGTASVLLGKSMNLTVLALSRSASRGAKLKELGADFVFSTDEQDLHQDG